MDSLFMKLDINPRSKRILDIKAQMVPSSILRRPTIQPPMRVRSTNKPQISFQPTLHPKPLLPNPRPSLPQIVITPPQKSSRRKRKNKNKKNKIKNTPTQIPPGTSLFSSLIDRRKKYD